MCLGLSSMAVVLSPSLLFLILVSHISDPITLFCSILSLLVLPSNDLKPFLELVMDMYCHSLEGGLECSSQSEIFQPTDPFLDILNQCLSKSSAKVPVSNFSFIIVFVNFVYTAFLKVTAYMFKCLL